MWAEIIRQLDLVEQHSEALDVEADAFDDDDPYDPMEFAEPDDELWQ
jgi:hypothetical protein